MLKFNYFLIIYVVNRRPQEEENSQETLFSKSNKSNKIPSGVWRGWPPPVPLPFYSSKIVDHL